MKHHSPLRYPGGKGKLAEHFAQVLAVNNLQDCTYVELYAGGAAVALSLLFNEHVQRIVINDVDRSIYAVWYCILNSTEEFTDLIQNTPVNIRIWQKQKEVQKRKASAPLLELGFSTFFLNRTNRSGILNGGVIGGKRQNGKWKIDARYNKEELIRRVRKIAEYKSRISLFNMDAVKFLREKQDILKGKVLLYLDPPYYVKGQDLYLNHYNDKDHAEVAAEISKLPASWIVTYDNVPFIRDLYSTFPAQEFNITYTANKVSEGKEVMVYSSNLQALPVQ